MRAPGAWLVLMLLFLSAGKHLPYRPCCGVLAVLAWVHFLDSAAWIRLPQSGLRPD